MSNRLAAETSPYLRQHRDNPVDWYPWGEEALARAREEDLPILLSVGYSACHWCHVMERESFEDPATAAYMNEHFVNVKVDREERPDVDALYMEFVQASTGHGGWPMTVFLDPEGVPFFGGTYFPPEPAPGSPSFMQVLAAVAAGYGERREEIRVAADLTRERLGATARIEPSGEPLRPALVDEAVAAIRRSADLRRGGFGGAPKFPPAPALELLLARGHTDVVEITLDGMAAGGIYDQIGGGFARYSVDAAWLVPHFEKMLYDNALLARAYLHGWQELGHERYRRVVTETLDWALAEMRGPEGGFHSALDADSEGEEGTFYLWERAEIEEVLGDDAPPVIEHLGVSGRGNFEGRNILHLPAGAAAEPPDGFASARRALYERRARRVRPGLDDKRIASWNALMIAALADAGSVLRRPDYLEAARDCAGFVLGGMRDGGGRLLRTYKGGEARIPAYLEDHAFLLEALLVLYQATFEVGWFERAREVAETMIARFADPEWGGFFSTADDGEQLIARRKDLDDHPIPSGSSSAAAGLLRLAALSGEREFERHAVGVLRLLAPLAGRQPAGFPHLLAALDFHLSPTRELALAGADTAELEEVARARLRPHLVLAGGPDGTSVPELMRGRTEVAGRPAAYLCENFTCQTPVTDPEQLRRTLDGDG
ncbi:MAG: thioredoxin domain-containing protein [Solirubrobacterales bacterium]